MIEEPAIRRSLDLCYAAVSVRGKRDRLQDNYFCTREVIYRGGTATAWAEVGGLDPGAESGAPGLPELLDFPIAAQLAGVRLFALADGVGGHNRGDLAASEAVRTLPLFYQPERLRHELEAQILHRGLAAKSPLEDFDRLAEADVVGALLRSTYQLINARLHFHDVADIRTTLVTLAMDFPRLYLANVGDSRVYRLVRDPVLGLRAPERLTVDDSHLDRKIYAGEFLPFAPCSYDVAQELRAHLESEGRYDLEFIFDLTRLEAAASEESFEQLCALAHEEIGRILSDGTARLFRRAMQLGTIAPAQQIKDEGLLRALGHQEWLSDAEISSTVRQGRRRPRIAVPEPRWLELGEGDLLLLCSDGLTDALPDSSIHQLLLQRLGDEPAAGARELSAVCQELVTLAEHDEACMDNVSAVLVQAPVSSELLRRVEAERPGRAALQVRVDQARVAEPAEPPAEPRASVGPVSRRERIEFDASVLPELPAMPRERAAIRPVEERLAARTGEERSMIRTQDERTEPRVLEDRARSVEFEMDKPAHERTASRFVQAVAEKKSVDREILSSLKRLETRLGDNDEKIEEMRLAVAELRGRLAGLSRRAELLERLGWIPLVGTASLILLVILLVIELSR